MNAPWACQCPVWRRIGFRASSYYGWMARTTETRELMVSRRALLPSVSFAKGLMGVLRLRSSRKWTMDASWSLEDVCHESWSVMVTG
jgi:hypothetical protein